MENVRENPTRDVSMMELDDKRIIPVPVLNKIPIRENWRPSQRLKIQKCRLAVERRSRCWCIVSMDLSTAPKALMVESPATKCSRISAVGAASARLTIDRALIYLLLTCAHQNRRATVKKLV